MHTGDLDGLVENFGSYDVARLIPTVADSKKEERATSVLLGAFRVVPALAVEMLQEVGAPSGKRAKFACFTEVVPKVKGSRLRPDGVIAVQSGKKLWGAVVEAKVGTAALKAEQIESYIDLARLLGCDAIITISNQYSTLPSHHPVQVNKTKLGKLGLYHFSWLSIISKAQLLAENKTIDDPEQAFILDELIRYLEHKSSGVKLMTQMGPGWRSVSNEIHQGARLLKSADNVAHAVATWHQLTRYLAVRLSQGIAQQVSIYLPRAHKNDPAKRLKNDIHELVDKHTLTEVFDVPNAAARITLIADFARRSVEIAMKLDAPKDKVRQTAPINWFLRQIKAEKPADYTIRVHWPGRTHDTMANLVDANEDVNMLLVPGVTSMPSSFEIVRSIDLMAGFKGKRKFVEVAEAELPRFYGDVGQHLRKWVPPAPKLKKKKEDETSAEQRAVADD